MRCDGWRENTEHPSETDLDEYASDGRFHLKFTTSLMEIDEVVDIIVDCVGAMA